MVCWLPVVDEVRTRTYSLSMEIPIPSEGREHLIHSELVAKGAIEGLYGRTIVSGGTHRKCRTIICP